MLIFFAVVPAINQTLLDIAFQEHQFMLAERWAEHKVKICGDSLTTSALVNITYLVFKGIEYEIEEIDTVLAEMRKRVTTFVDNRERERRGTGQKIDQTGVGRSRNSNCPCSNPGRRFLPFLLLLWLLWRQLSNG